MRIDVDRLDFECIIDALKGQLTKSQFKRAAELVERLTTPYTPKNAHWAPIKIRSSWPSGVVKPAAKHNSFYHKPRATKSQAKVPKAPSADEILASL